MPDTPQTPTLRQIIETNLWAVYQSSKAENMEDRTDAIIAAFEQYLTDGALPSADTDGSQGKWVNGYNDGLEEQRKAYLKGLK